MVGRMKIIKLVLLRSRPRDRNRLPITGRSPSKRDLLDRAPLILVEQPADHGDLAILDHERVLALALVEDEILATRRGRPRNRADLDPQVHLDRPARIDLRPHLQRDADILPLHGAERIVEIGAQRLAGGDRNLLPDQEARLLIVERKGRRDRQQVRRIVRPHRVQDRAEQGVARAKADAGHAARNPRQRRGALLDQIRADAGGGGGRPVRVADHGGPRQLACARQARNLAEVRAQIGIIGDAERNGRAIEAAQEQPRAELLRGAVGQLDDHRLDQHLLAPHVELADHLAQHLLHVLRGRDDDRVGALEPGHYGIAVSRRHFGGRRAPDRLRRLRTPAERSRRLDAGLSAQRSGIGPRRLLLLIGEAAIFQRLRGGRLLARAGSAAPQQLRSIGMLQIDHPHVRKPRAARWSSSAAIAASRARVGASPRSATELALSIGTTDTPSGASR
jgi:hypothetical protein